MKPTIGRVVIFTDNSEEFKQRNNFSNVAPATIVRVWNEQGTVNLKVHVDGLVDEWRPSVLSREQVHESYAQGDEVKYLAWWEWPVIASDKPDRGVIWPDRTGN